MSDDPMARVQYFERQHLRPRDLQDEQAYHLGMRRRHNLSHHSWGIVHGLELDATPGEPPAVRPGVAVDGYGRELVLASRQPLPVAAFDDRQTDALEVWLVYDRLATEPPLPGWGGCEPAGGAAHYRWCELARVEVRVPQPPLDARRPPDVPREDLDFDASRTPPDDPRRRWPVYLGRLSRQRQDGGEATYSADPAGRPYAGLVAARLESPPRLEGDEQRWVRVEFGGSDDSEGSVLAVAEMARQEEDGATTREAVFELTRRPDEPARAKLHGDLEVAGDVSLEGSLDLSATAEPGNPSEPGNPRVYVAKDDDSFRIELGTGAQDRLEIGSTTADGFAPCLTVEAKRDKDRPPLVTVHGDLQLDGKIEDQLLQRPVATRRLSPDAQRFQLSSFLSGVAGANVLVPLAQVAARPKVNQVDDLLATLRGQDDLRREVLRRLDPAEQAKLRRELAPDGGDEPEGS